MYTSSGVLLFLVLGATGCQSSLARGKAVKTAAFDHNCPEESVKVISEDTDIWAYKLDVCGKSRKYRDRGNAKEWQFVDVTDDPAAGGDS